MYFKVFNNKICDAHHVNVGFRIDLQTAYPRVSAWWIFNFIYEKKDNRIKFLTIGRL